ncbi:hypothetical protein [Mycoplasma suis]|uniref:Uncharacterized protein n=1 Tax=Mycoplasma suis (strain Illinois) TaxID=768700 RepID=F0QRZ9_MYCSL|nr:hypothetical protein [Mycoplasma suis]ADX98269.1 hypothetical protein MSU_0744 [Mycoplasma suis str. Illinois]
MFWKLQTKFWLGGSLTKNQLYAACGTIAGGGILVSVVGSEYINNGQIASQIKGAFNTFIGWFTPTQDQQQQQLQPSEQQPFSFGNFFSEVGSKLGDVFSFIKTIAETMIQSWKNVSESIKKMKSQELQQQDSQQSSGNMKEMKFEFKSIFRGILALWGMMYKDVFTVENGSFLYLLSNLLIKTEEWTWLKTPNQRLSWDKWKQSIEKTYKEMGSRFEKGARDFLVLLAILDQIGQQKNKNQPSSISQKITLSRNNMQWLGYSFGWVSEEAKSK